MKILAVALLLLIPVTAKAQCAKGDTVKIAVTGHVKNPGFFKVDQYDTFADVITKAGGLAQDAGLNDITVHSDGTVIRTRNELMRNITDGAPNCMFDGDEVLVKAYHPHPNVLDYIHVLTEVIGFTLLVRKL